ncbi:MAG: hypothetical protein H5U39_04180 [Deferribacterales bacterium]|nr:hypothetical protein [Deferribacterales bacterium]
MTAYGQELGEFELNFPGEHNISNSLAAIGISLEFSIDIDVIKTALKNFKGVQRRLSKRFETDNIVVFDDYGHHPTEIKATLKAIREAYEDRKVVVVFQPHRYTRTKLLMNDFAKSFFNSDVVFVTDIYAASEDPIEGVNSQALVEEIKKHGFKDVFYLEKESDFFKHCEKLKDENLVIVTLGAGSITKFSFEIAEFLGGVYER